MWDIKEIITSITWIMRTNYHCFGLRVARQDSGPTKALAMIVRPILLVVGDYFFNMGSQMFLETSMVM